MAATATIFFRTESPYIGLHDLIVLDPYAAVDAAARGIRMGIPIGLRLAALTQALARTNGIRGRLPRNTSLSRDPAVDAVLLELDPVSTWMLDCRAFLVLPAATDADDEFYAGNPATAELVEAVNADPDARAAVVHRARVAIEAAAPAPPRRKVVPAAILREYHMYGAVVAEMAPAELDAILGDIEGAGPPSGPKVPAPIARLPYRDFALGEPTDCLVNGLIAKYSGLAPSKRVAESSIRKWFAEDAGGPSLLRLKEFTEHYKIPLRVYDGTGAEVHAMTRHNTGQKKEGQKKEGGGRPGLALIAWNNHAYFFQKTLNTTPDFSAQLPHDIEGYYDSRCLKKMTPDGVAQELTAEEDEILQAALALDNPNFSYEAENDVCVRNLMYARSGAVLSVDSAGWDMNKAYYTATMATSAAYPCLSSYLGNQSIPVFTALDDYRSAADTAFPPKLYWGATYFFVSKPCMERFQSGTGHAAGRISNLITGIEFAYMMDRGILSACDVIGWKTATYSIQEDKFRRWLESLDGAPRDPAAPISTLKSFFALLNGLLGRSWTRPHIIGLTAPSENDIDLLSLTHSRVSEEKLVDGRTQLTLTMGEQKYLYLNTKHLYSHVIGRMNLFMMKLIDDIATASPDAVLLKIKVDAVVYDRPIVLPAWAAPIFKPETPRVADCNYRHMVHDPSKLQEAITLEIDALVAKCVVYTGPPGTGKTTTVHRDHDYDVALSFSNVCARNLDHATKSGTFVKGETLHTGLGLCQAKGVEATRARLKDKVLWVDEFSTVQSWVWSVLVSLLKQNLKVLILTGDPDQIPPVKEHFRGKSTLIRTLLDGAQHLTTDYRNDEQLIGMRNLILDTPEGETDRIVSSLEQLRAVAPEMSADQIPAKELAALDVHITYTNLLRLAVNQMVIEARGLVYALRGSDQYKATPRTVFAWTASKGLRLRAKINRKGQGIYKGAVYELLSGVTWITDTVKLRRIHLDLSRAPEEPFEIPIKDFSAFELGYALTAHSSIGQTVRGQKLAIYQARQMIEVDKSILYVAVTRACKLSNVVFSLDIPEHISKNLSALADRAGKNEAPAPVDDEPEFELQYHA